MGAQGQAQAATSKANDTLNTKVVPIVLVPGVMGSRLDISTTSADWDPDNKITMAGWLRKRRRTATNDMFFSTPMTLMTDLVGSAGGPRPSTEIFDRPRLRQIAQAQLDPKLPSRARPSAETQLWESRGWGEVSWTFYGPILIDLEERLNRATWVRSCDRCTPVATIGDRATRRAPSDCVRASSRSSVSTRSPSK